MRRGAERRACTRAAAMLLLSFLWASESSALERLQRKFDLERGLPFSEVYSVKQDSRGFIWIATGGGLFRYDGVDLRPWPRESFRTLVKNVSTGPAGEVLLLDYTGGLYEVAGEVVQPVIGPAGAPFLDVAPPVWDAHGNLWVAAPGRLWFRPAAGEWREFPLSPLGSERPSFLDVSEEGAPIVITDAGIWRIDERLHVFPVASIARIQKALVRADGSVLVQQSSGRVVELRDGAEREVYRLAARPIDMVQRGRTLWISYDTCLAAVTPGEPPEVLGLRNNLTSGGSLLVDQEGNLWIGTFRGLVQFPAPDTVAFGMGDGMASNGARRLALSPEGIWVDSWGGLTLVRREGSSWRPEPIPNTGTSPVCVGTDETMWAGYAGRFLERRGGRFIAHPRPDLRYLLECAAGAEGRVWMFGNLGLSVAGGRAVPPKPVASPDPARASGVAVSLLEDSAGRLWVTAGDEVCHADANAVTSGASAGWACSKPHGTGGILSLAEISPGRIWAATLSAGVYRLTSEGPWEQIPGSRELPTRLVRKVRPSPSGGAWIVSYGTILRAVERPGSAEGWEIVERLSPWHGLMISDAEDILEEASGDLWITTLAGLVHIPDEVRRAAPKVPRVELVDVIVDGEPLAWQGGITLPYSRNRIELRFAGLSYRDPGLLRYQVRLRPDAPWRDASARPYFQFVDLPPGRYQAEVRASLDGAAWSARTAGLSFTVLPPFYRTWWFTALAVLAIASAAYALYRYRVAQLLRLERIRTRIAADLHDDIGASLSRIAMQSELVRRPEVLRPLDAERLLSEIGESARSLVDGMSDIVWSIDPKRDDLASLVSRVRQFALGMLEPLGVSLEISVPGDAGKVRLAPGQRRHLYLIFKEAINNVARHAGCRNVAITLRLDGGRLLAEVKDDGRGFDGAAVPAAISSSRGGHGLVNMKARAEQLGGTLSIASAPGEGATVKLACVLERIGA